MALYHERQVGSYCRLHAINNLMGRQICSTADFDALCSEFDKMNRVENNISRTGQVFYNNGGVDNIFGHVILKKSGIHNDSLIMKHKDFYRVEAPKVEETISVSGEVFILRGFIVYNAGHTWCIRGIGCGTGSSCRWVQLDSMNAKQPTVMPLAALTNRGIGAISVYIRKGEMVDSDVSAMMPVVDVASASVPVVTLPQKSSSIPPSVPITTSLSQNAGAVPANILKSIPPHLRAFYIRAHQNRMNSLMTSK